MYYKQHGEDDKEFLQQSTLEDLKQLNLLIVYLPAFHVIRVGIYEGGANVANGLQQAIPHLLILGNLRYAFGH